MVPAPSAPVSPSSTSSLSKPTNLPIPTLLRTPRCVSEFWLEKF